MARAASATARGIFSWGAPRRRGLWRPWPGEEKHLQLAQLQQDGGHPAGKVQAVLLPIHQPPAAGEALHLSYVSFSDTNLLSVVWFGSRSRSCSETSWSLDLTGPFETRNGREMGNETEFETRNGRKWETKRYKKHHFSTINEKNRVKTGKTGEKSLKNRKKQEKTENYKKYRNKFLTRFREMLKTETETMSSRMSRNDDSRAKTMYRCKPTQAHAHALTPAPAPSPAPPPALPYAPAPPTPAPPCSYSPLLLFLLLLLSLLLLLLLLLLLPLNSVGLQCHKLTITLVTFWHLYKVTWWLILGKQCQKISQNIS